MAELTEIAAKVAEEVGVPGEAVYLIVLAIWLPLVEEGI